MLLKTARRCNKKEYKLNKTLKLVYTYEGHHLKCHILFVIERVLTKERKSEHYLINQT